MGYNLEKIKVPRFNEENGFYTTKQRSQTMSKIRAKETQPEIALRKALYNKGIRYRKNYKKLPGNPDIVLIKHKLAIFIDGSFWHGYKWEEKKPKIKANRDFWIKKIERNMQRDAENNNLLSSLGYTVIRFWDHDVKKKTDDCIQIILDKLKPISS